MPKPAKRILSSDPGQHLNDCILEGFARARAHASQEGFQFGKGSLDWGEIG